MKRMLGWCLVLAGIALCGGSVFAEEKITEASEPVSVVKEMPKMETEGVEGMTEGSACCEPETYYEPACCEPEVTCAQYIPTYRPCCRTTHWERRAMRRAWRAAWCCQPSRNAFQPAYTSSACCAPAAMNCCD